MTALSHSPVTVLSPLTMMTLVAEVTKIPGHTLVHVHGHRIWKKHIELFMVGVSVFSLI